MPPVAFRSPFERTSEPPLNAVAVIPARYQSTRFPGKPLADIAGRTMIEHVYARAAAAGVDAVVVATDDERIARAVESFGGLARMTSPAHRTGLDRVAEVAADLDCRIVVNVQGDEPLIEPRMIAEVMRPLLDDGAIPMSTLRRRLEDPEDIANPDIVKVVADTSGNALYFSRSAIPHARGGASPVFKHIGLYAYQRPFVRILASCPQTPLEMAESLEQLRALEHGFRIRVIDTQFDSIGVDSPGDLERVRRQFAVGARA